MKRFDGTTIHAIHATIPPLLILVYMPIYTPIHAPMLTSYQHQTSHRYYDELCAQGGAEGRAVAEAAAREAFDSKVAASKLSQGRWTRCLALPCFALLCLALPCFALLCCVSCSIYITSIDHALCHALCNSLCNVPRPERTMLPPAAINANTNTMHVCARDTSDAEDFGEGDMADTDAQELF